MARVTGCATRVTMRARAKGRADAGPVCVFTLPRRARKGTVGLIDYLRQTETYYASAIDDAVAFMLDRSVVSDEQSEAAYELVYSIRDQLAGEGRSIRLTFDEARLLAELLDGVLHWQRDYDWRIEAAAIAADDLDDAPTEREYSDGAWALERTRARLASVPSRPSVRQGDLLTVAGEELLPDRDYEIVAVSETGLDLRDADGQSHQVERADFARMDADVEQRFSAPGMAVPEVPDPPPPPEPPWTDDDRRLQSLIGIVSLAQNQLNVLRRDIAACEQGFFDTSHPERTANKFGRQMPHWEEMKANALPRIEELKARPTERTSALLEKLDWVLSRAH